MKVAIAGASGFIGQLLVNELLKIPDISIRGLSRTNPHLNEKVEYKTCDLFSFESTKSALEDIDIAVYLIHSMMPTARLDQGSFQDYDLILADNFVRACEEQKVKKIIYLGGMLPSSSHEKELSHHLKSRLEVEKTLSSRSIPCVTLRAGMIVESLGSSFDLFVRVSKLSPIIPLPPWSMLKTEVVDALDIVEIIEQEILNDNYLTSQFDVGCGETMTYAELLKRLVEIQGLKVLFFNVPYLPFWVLKVFLTIVTSAPYQFINPLVGSLKYEIFSRENERYPFRWHSLNDTLKRVLAEKDMKKKPKLFNRIGNIKYQKKVRSVQRFEKKAQLHADAISFAYLHWLPKFLKPFLKVEKKNHFIRFYSWGISTPLLELEHVYQRSSRDRQLYFIKGGLLAIKDESSRLEFREVLNGEYVLAAIHEFKPRLPWWLYRISQAPLHLFVMTKFGQWLKSKS